MSRLQEAAHLPPGTKPLSTQVAGHKYGDGKVGCLEVTDGTILKHVQCPPKGHRERDFYREIFDSNTTDNVLLELRPLIPRFHGVVPGEKNGTVKQEFLKLENITKNLSRPCILDIKMGRRTYDPEASPEKIALEIAKFPPVMQLGYQFSGMLKYDPEKKKMKKFDKYFCKKLTEDTMTIDGLGEFFRQGKHYRKDYIKTVIEKLQRIDDWFSKQRRYAFYASSLLIVYNASVDHPRCSPDSQINDQQESISTEDSCHDNSNNDNHDRSYVDVRMIDFTHVFPSENEKDENYIFGLQNLIEHLQSLLEL